MVVLMSPAIEILQAVLRHCWTRCAQLPPLCIPQQHRTRQTLVSSVRSSLSSHTLTDRRPNVTNPSRPSHLPHEDAHELAACVRLVASFWRNPRPFRAGMWSCCR